MKVFINPGHSPNGQPDCGAVNRQTGLRECDVALTVGRLAEKYLAAAGCTVSLLQSNNLAGESPDQPNVVATANNSGADIFVSIHCNADHEAARGAETLCFENSGKTGVLADCIQKQLITTLRRIDDTFPDRGIKERPNLIVLNSTKMPAVLVETAFIDNKEDADILVMYSDEIARAIARGVTDYWQHEQ